MRSAWKCINDLGNFKKRFRKNVSLKLLRARGSQPSFYIWNRAAVIPKFYVKKRIGVYTGRMYHSLIVRKFMVGRHFGEFSVTKKLGLGIHLKQIKKKFKK